jgi:hypothetical protein
MIFPIVTSAENPPAPDPVVVADPYANFPAELRFALSTSDELLDDVKIDRATDGTGRAQMFYVAPKHSIAAALNGISATAWDTFDNFYRTMRGQVFTIPWGSCDAPTDLPVIFATPPRRTFLGNGRSSVSFTLVEFP